MANVDVSEVLLDPDLCDRFDVTRRAEVMGADGRASVVGTVFSGVIGVVVASSPSGMERRDDGQMLSHTATVVTKFRLRGPAPGFQPDQITIDGTTFTVLDILPFSRFGAGFVEATAEAMSAAAAPPG